MKKELEDKIVSEFPQYFPDFRGDPSKTCLAWGLEIGEGWFDILYQLCKDIQTVNPKHFQFEQVKEKFGELRVYCIIKDDNTEIFKQTSKLVSEAEVKSRKVCEACGTTENVTHGGERWIRTECADCKSKREGK